MSTQWEIVDTKNKRRFDLDKGDWFSERMYREPSPMTLAEVREWVAAVMVARYGAQSVGDDDYHDRVSRSVWAFCEVAEWKVMTVNNDGEYPDDDMIDWPRVAGRCGGSFDPDPCAAQTIAALDRAT